MDDLSDEETELEELVRLTRLTRGLLTQHGQNMNVHNRGYSFLIPIGRTLTQLEEKNDVSTYFLNTSRNADAP